MYQVLYRKHRPTSFAGVYGQEAITAALRGEVRSGRLAHAYLFTGSRGTGKTSCARLLAKAANCLSPVDGDPCGVCDSCKGLEAGTILDVAEIDAASNNGVDNIRDLREEVGFTPVSAKYRVYIIDEVHMLSAGAFNALLKTLEEPPAHAIFILATTEVHKLPATILSRCQRFDFARIPPGDIAACIAKIAEQETFTVTAEAALLLGRLADGAMRDALSLLDQCVSRADAVDAEVVAQAAGLVGREHLYALIDALREGDRAALLRQVEVLHRQGRDMERLCGELLSFLRDLMILQHVGSGGAGELLTLSDSEIARLGDVAAACTQEQVLYWMERLQAGTERLRFAGTGKRLEVEMVLLELTLSRAVGVSGASVVSGAPAGAKMQSVPRGVAQDAAVRGASQSATPQADSQRSPQSVPQSASDGTAMAVATASQSAVVPISSPEEGGANAPSAADTPQNSPPPGQMNSPPGQMNPPPGQMNPPPGQPNPPSSPPAPNAAASDGETAFLRWDEVLSVLARSCVPLYAVLQSSRAMRRGDMLLIETADEMFRTLVAQDGNKAKLLDAVRTATGESLRIGVKRPAANAEESSAQPVPAASAGAFSQALKEWKNMGIVQEN